MVCHGVCKSYGSKLRSKQTEFIDVDPVLQFPGQSCCWRRFLERDFLIIALIFTVEWTLMNAVKRNYLPDAQQVDKSVDVSSTPPTDRFVVYSYIS